VSGDVRAKLVDVDVPRAELRRDPSGRSWLGEPARNPESAPDIARFVEGERALFDEADVGADPLFTARVLASLPQRPVGAGLSARRRLAVLAGGYLAAAAVGWVVLDSESATVSGVATATHDAIDALEGVPIAVLAVVAIAVVLATIALVSKHLRQPGFSEPV
jgi:hypothetical protein